MTESPFRLLLIEDDPDSSALLRALIEESFGEEASLQCEATYASAFEALKGGDHDLCLLNQHIGERSAFDLVHDARASGGSTPVILLTDSSARSVRQIDRAAAEAIAAICLDKDEITAPLIEWAIRHAIRAARVLARTKQFESLAENAPDIIARYDRGYRHLYVNPVITVMGLPREAFLGRTIADIGIPGEIVRRLQNAIDSVFEAGLQVTVEWSYRALKQLVLQSHFTPEFGPDGTVASVLCISRDITELRTIQDALLGRERRFRTLAERSIEVLTLVDRDGTVIYESPSVEAIFGYEAHELAGEPAFVKVHPEDQPAAEEALRQVLETGAATEIEYRHQHGDGTWRLISAVVENLLEDPDVGAIVVHSRDITEARKTETQLHQSQKLEAVGQLAGGIAHDFNNVLLVIKGRAALTLIDLPEDSPLREDIEEIDYAADRAADLTHQLLAFSRQQVLEPKVLDLNDTVVDVERMLCRVLGEDIECITVPNPELGHVRADPGQIEQILMNLAVNARDAMPTGGKLITEMQNVELSEAFVGENGSEVVPGSYVLLSVSDTGTGMSPDVQARIFEPFYTTKPKGRGTGMGLSTVYGIVKQSGGYVWVYSEEGRGTTFKLYLPRVDDEELPPVPASAPGEAQTNAVILLVEDEPAVRSTGRRLLERMGHTVLEAGGGEQALRIAEEHPGEIDVILTDVVMPLMSGRELVERLLPGRPGMRVLYTSGYTDEAVIRHGVLEGSAAFLQKPYQAAALAEKLDEVLSQTGTSV